MDRTRAYVERLSAQLVEWDRQLDSLSHKADRVGAELRAVYLQEINNLMLQRQAVELKLQKVAVAGNAPWQEMHEGGDDILDEVRADIHDAILNIK